MATFAAIRHPLALLPLLRWKKEPKQSVASRPFFFTRSTTALTQASIALAAKLVVVDGAMKQSEYQAFRALFTEGGDESASACRQFVKHLHDRWTALPFARRIGAMKITKTVRRDLVERLLQLAMADGALNAAEMEMLRSIADAVGLPREDFRALINTHLLPAKSPYEVLGVTSNIDDETLRARYMAQAQVLHPDRYQAAGASPETVSMLSDQLAALNNAYQEIRAQRAKKSAALFGRRNAKSAKAA